MTATALFPSSGIERDTFVELVARTLVPDSPTAGDAYFRGSGWRLLEGVSHYLLGRIDDAEHSERCEMAGLPMWKDHPVSAAMLLDFVVSRIGVWIRSDEPTVTEQVRGILDDAHARSLSKKIDRGFRPLLGMAPCERLGVLKMVEEAVAGLRGRFVHPVGHYAKDTFLDALSRSFALEEKSRCIMLGILHASVEDVSFDEGEMDLSRSIRILGRSGDRLSLAMLGEQIMSSTQRWIDSEVGGTPAAVQSAHDEIREIVRSASHEIEPLLSLSSSKRIKILASVNLAASKLI